MCGCGKSVHVYGTKGPAVNELLFALRKHRNPEMAKVHRGFFKALMDKTTIYESRMLEVLNLPGIEQVRRAIVTGATAQTGDQFRYQDTMALRLKVIIREWLEDLLGPEYASSGKGLTDSFDFTSIKWIVVRFLAEAFDVEARNQYRHLQNIADDGTILAMIMPDPNRDYFRAMLKAAGKRISTELAVRRMDKVRDMLIDMSYKGRWPIEVGRKLHDIIGEGAAWYWQRIARSEATLAANLAFDKMAQENGCNYEEWSAGAGCCIICGWLDGKVWRLGEGPEPVSSTHPHCMCARIATYGRGGHSGELQPRWTRPSPYKNEPGGMSWSQAELDKMREDLKTRRSDLSSGALPPSDSGNSGPFKTIKEAERWLKDKFPHWKVDLKNCHIDAINESLVALDDLAREYPEAANHFAGLFNDILRDDRYAEFRKISVEMVLNSNFFKFPVVLREALEEDVKTGWHPKHTGKISSVLIHEFGHGLEDYWKKSLHFSYSPVVREDGTGEMSRFTNRIFSKLQSSIDTNLSAYALKNDHEAFSEAFAEMILGGAESHPATIEMDRLITGMGRLFAETNRYSNPIPWSQATPEQRAEAELIFNKVERLINELF
jgi:hypothetical protein